MEHLQLDHIVPFFENGRHHLSNLQWLCAPCHKRKSADEARRHRANNRHVYERPPMPEEQRKQVSEFFRGRPKTPEQIEKVRAGLKRSWERKGPEERRAIGEKSAAKQRGRKLGPMPEERKQKIGEAQKRAWASGKRKAVPDAGARLQVASRAWWDQATPEQRAQRGAAISTAKQKSVGP